MSTSLSELITMPIYSSDWTSIDYFIDKLINQFDKCLEETSKKTMQEWVTQIFQNLTPIPELNSLRVTFDHNQKKVHVDFRVQDHMYYQTNDFLPGETDIIGEFESDKETQFANYIAKDPSQQSEGFAELELMDFCVYAVDAITRKYTDVHLDMLAHVTNIFNHKIHLCKASLLRDPIKRDLKVILAGSMVIDATRSSGIHITEFHRMLLEIKLILCLSAEFNKLFQSIDSANHSLHINSDESYDIDDTIIQKMEKIIQIHKDMSIEIRDAQLEFEAFYEFQCGDLEKEDVQSFKK